jgi:hypothetical protein
VHKVEWGRIYDFVRAADLATLGHDDDEAFEEAFVGREGTRDEFIANKEREWREKNPQLLDILQKR